MRGLVKEEVGTPESDAVDDGYTSREVVATQVFLFLDIVPFGATPFLVFEDTLAELVVPHMGSCHIDGVGTEGEGKTFSILTFA